MPDVAPEQPPPITGPPAAADFDALYEARYGDVVAMAHALTDNFAEAQDLAQEAFCRAWQRWPVVATYDDPLPGSAGSRPTSPRPVAAIARLGQPSAGCSNANRTARSALSTRCPLHPEGN